MSQIPKTRPVSRDQSITWDQGVSPRTIGQKRQNESDATVGTILFRLNREIKRSWILNKKEVWETRMNFIKRLSTLRIFRSATIHFHDRSPINIRRRLCHLSVWSYSVSQASFLLWILLRSISPFILNKIVPTVAPLSFCRFCPMVRGLPLGPRLYFETRDTGSGATETRILFWPITGSETLLEAILVSFSVMSWLFFGNRWFDRKILMYFTLKIEYHIIFLYRMLLPFLKCKKKMRRRS